MLDLSSLTEDQTCTPCSGSAVLTTGLPGKSVNSLFSSDSCFGVVLCGKLELRHLIVSVPSGHPQHPGHGVY